jgi:hypothetical protein
LNQQLLFAIAHIGPASQSGFDHDIYERAIALALFFLSGKDARVQLSSGDRREARQAVV